MTNAPNDDDDERYEATCKDIIDELLKNKKITPNFLNNIKNKVCKKYSLGKIPKNADILAKASEEEKEILIPILQRRKTRTLSGVSVIAVMTKPYECPGECIYCPGLASQPGESVAQSYTGREPAAMRSLMHNYDPFKQVSSRVDDLEAIGHACDKIELIIMGGTFLSTPVSYQKKFIKGCIEGVLGEKTRSLTEAKLLAETSNRRIIGETFETRPDYCKNKHIDAMLDYGGTRVEIGIQTTRDDIFQLVHRGHDTQESKRAIQAAKDAGFKVCLHLMPNLPGATIEADEEMFNTIFSDEDYKPDYLKIYPCLVIGGTELEQWWREGKYEPYSTDSLIGLLAKVKSTIPNWIRIQRVQRDIPAYLILDGVKYSNLREMVWNRMDEMELECNCIRCNEYGFSRIHELKKRPIPSIDELQLNLETYKASGGIESFMSARDGQTGEIFGYVRMRIPSSLAHRPEINSQQTAIIRELRVVGELVRVNEVANTLQAQHRGLGKKLMQYAENAAIKTYNASKIVVIAGIGVREYFYNLGYLKDGPYVSKIL